MKKVLCLALACCLLLGLFSITALGASEELASTSLPFHDVSENDWFYSYVSYMYQNGIMSGTSATTFAPRINFSRAMVVTTLFRIYNGRQANETDPRNSGFSDVLESAWFAPYITWARENAIVDGVGGNRFAPLNDVSRQEFATILFRYQGMIGEDTAVKQGEQWNNFTDLHQVQQWAIDGMTWANYHGIITGRTSTTIAPTAMAIRAEAGAMLMRFSNISGGDLPTDLINLRDLLGLTYHQIVAQYGHLFGSSSAEFHYSDMWGWDNFWIWSPRVIQFQVVNLDLSPDYPEWADFATADPRTAAILGVRAMHPIFHLDGLTINSSFDDVVARFGEPARSDYFWAEGSGNWGEGNYDLKIYFWDNGTEYVRFLNPVHYFATPGVRLSVGWHWR